MSSLTIALISAACIFGGVLLGLCLQNLLPDHHLSNDSKDTVKLGAGMIATLSALVLGLLVSSAKSTFDTMNSEITLSGAKIVYLDRVLADYGPETQNARELLRHCVIASLQMFWPEEKNATSGMAAFERANGMEVLQMKLLELKPATEIQRQMFQQSQQICSELRQSRWLLIEQAQNVLPKPFLVMLIFWLTALHMSFGLSKGGEQIGLYTSGGAVVAFLFLSCSSNSFFPLLSPTPLKNLELETGRYRRSGSCSHGSSCRAVPGAQEAQASSSSPASRESAGSASSSGGVAGRGDEIVVAICSPQAQARRAGLRDRVQVSCH